MKTKSKKEEREVHNHIKILEMHQISANYVSAHWQNIVFELPLCFLFFVSEKLFM